MNILEVAKGLEEGRVYRLKEWGSYGYLCTSTDKKIKQYNTITVEDYQLTTIQLLSTEWEECSKDTWYVVEANEKFDEYGNVYFLSMEKENYDPYCGFNLKIEDIEHYKHYLDIQIVEENLNEEDVKKLKRELAK